MIKGYIICPNGHRAFYLEHEMNYKDDSLGVVPLGIYKAKMVCRCGWSTPYIFSDSEKDVETRTYIEALNHKAKIIGGR